uniref:Receptor kinase-like protein Xa21 n=2 Tax=Oryza brachyantha TaxID=4533 RepID=J3N264_ORYBR
MFLVLKLLPSLYILLMASTAYVQALPFSNGTDLDALLAFKAGLSFQSDPLPSWNATTDFCWWHGVICSLKHKRRVLVLNLSSAGLVGYIAPSIGNLTYLRSLDLSYNLLHGEIPPTIGQLSQMSYLDLSNNSLQGEITHGLRNCTRLVSIKLDLNKLDHGIPDWLGGLSRIKVMSVGKNGFTGIIPSSVGNLSSLQEMYLNDNQFSGPIPESLGRLSKLEVLALQVNNLSRNIPRTIFNLSSLVQIGVEMNELDGTLPSDLGNGLPKIQYLILALNHLTGSIPASIANATTMYSMDLSGNNFTGIIPPEIGTLCPNFLLLNGNQLMASSAQDWEFLTSLTNCTSLRGVTLQNNRLGGALPNSITNLSEHLQLLDLRFNEITNKIPVGIGNFPNLIKLGLSSNRFTGLIPDNIGRLTMLQFLTLENNLLSGRMPSLLGNLTQLQHLSVDNNNLDGPLPASLGNLKRLVSATFSNNLLSGPLPGEIFSLSSLSFILDLSGNQFISPLPSELGGLTKLTYLYMHNNNLSGALPDALSSCQSLMELRMDGNSLNSIIPVSISKLRGLELLNLTKNSFTGAIPEELGLMTGLKELYLAHNNLSLQIPESFISMTSLYQLDISFNDLDGQVPTHGVFSNLTGFLLVGNDKLCGGIQELHLPSCQVKSMEHNRRILKIIQKAGILSASVILVCCILALLVFSLKKRLSPLSERVEIIASSFMNEMYPRVSYSDLAKATNDFTSNNLVGTGRYGSVYKGRMQFKNSVSDVAVKIFDLEQSGSSKSFEAECEALSRIQHRNLIGVITCCSCPNLNQNDFKALVFEFMPYGSLDRWIHPDTDTSNPVKVLTLMQRLNISADIGAALDYLHNCCQPRIVHCDLKPSNILLGDNMVARVGDFGLAKILTDPEGEQLINSKSSVGIMGTIGYVAPEYGEGGQISPNGDVYSFGILLLEMFTGKAPTHEMFSDGLTLQKYVEMAYPELLMDIVDPLLLSVENGWGIINCVMSAVTGLALVCCRRRPTDRLCMREVVADIHTIRASYVANINKVVSD